MTQEQISQLTEQNRSQELEIYRLRAENAQLGKRVSDLQRIFDASQRYIGRLEAKLSPMTQAEAVFRK